VKCSRVHKKNAGFVFGFRVDNASLLVEESQA